MEYDPVDSLLIQCASAFDGLTGTLKRRNLIVRLSAFAVCAPDACVLFKSPLI